MNFFFFFFFIFFFNDTATTEIYTLSLTTLFRSIFIIPIAVGFALLHLPKRFVAPVRYGVGLLTLYLWVYNVALIVKYLF